MSNTDENVNQTKEFILKNRRTIINILGNSFSWAESILKENVNMHHTASIFMHCLLGEKQKSVMSVFARTFRKASKTQILFEDNHSDKMWFYR
jgi:hypothetical protein